VEYKRPAAGIPCAIFTKFAEFVYTPFQDSLVVKCCWIFSRSRGYRVMRVFNWRGLVTPTCSAPPSGETMHQSPKSFRDLEHARGPLSPCQVWWGSDFTRRRGGQNVEFFCPSLCLYVCLFICSSCVWMSECVRPISPCSVAALTPAIRSAVDVLMVTTIAFMWTVNSTLS